MSAADDAYAETLRRIELLKAEGRKGGSYSLELDTDETRAITRLPPEIVDLPWLHMLDLSNTQIFDFSLIATLTHLNTLSLDNTQINDLSPLSDLRFLNELYLNGTLVTDLSPIENLTGLEELYLKNTFVKDLSPIAKLTGLERLHLDGSEVTDLRPLTGLDKLFDLSLTHTHVSDIWPLTKLPQLVLLALDGSKVLDLRPVRGIPRYLGGPLDFIPNFITEFDITFQNTDAAHADPNIADIANIADDATRAQELFDYLKDWVPPFGTEELPPRQPAPLETEIQDDQLRRRNPDLPPLSAGAVDDRARKGWQALRDFRQDFGNALNIENYRPLAAAISALDRAMGASYDLLNQIGVGLTGQRLSNLASDVAFTDCLPDGAGSELATLAAAVTTFSNRFPEWQEYLADSTAAEPVAGTVAAALPNFLDLARTLATTEGVAPDVIAEYRDEVELVRENPKSEPYARALLASTTDLLRTLTENALIGMRLYANDAWDEAKSQTKKFVDVAKTELRKAAFWGVVAVPTGIILHKSAYLLALSAQFPALLSWLPKALAALGLV